MLSVLVYRLEKKKKTTLLGAHKKGEWKRTRWFFFVLSGNLYVILEKRLRTWHYYYTGPLRRTETKGENDSVGGWGGGRKRIPFYIGIFYNIITVRWLLALARHVQSSKRVCHHRAPYTRWRTTSCRSIGTPTVAAAVAVILLLCASFLLRST